MGAMAEVKKRLPWWLLACVVLTALLVALDGLVEAIGFHRWAEQAYTAIHGPRR
jgi:hypothetical protein